MTKKRIVMVRGVGEACQKHHLQSKAENLYFILYYLFRSVHELIGNLRR